MRALLDTHALLWFILDDPKLPRVAKEIVADGSNDIAVSPASYWEIAIKISLGKYRLPEPYGPFMERELTHNAFRILPILPRHTSLLTDLPFHHRDPFDRLLIAQCLADSLPMISGDPSMDDYGVDRIWRVRTEGGRVARSDA
jgi:PIN domain nuclease of toxin-antitoxin system